MSTTQNQRKSQEIAAHLRDLHETHYGRMVNSMTAIVRDRDAAEDITAAAFGKALEKLTQFRGESSLYTWVYAIARNDAQSRRSPKRIVSLDASEALPPELVEQPRLDRDSDRFEHRHRLRKALSAVPAVHRRALVDHVVRRYPVKRIARRERVPVGTVLSRIYAGKRALRAAWEA